MAKLFLPHNRLQELLDGLAGMGYQVFGPTVAEGLVVISPLKDAAQLPWGARDIQEPGKYTLEKGDPNRAFGWVSGPTSLKPFVFRQMDTLWQASVDGQGNATYSTVTEAPKQAVIGARPCDLAAMPSLDIVYGPDPRYSARRSNLFIAVVNCTRSSAMCFCLSVGGSPQAGPGYDLVMTEIEGGLVVEPGTDVGRDLLDSLGLKEATLEQLAREGEEIANAHTTQSMRLPSQEEFARVLPGSKNSKQWDLAAEKCESCGNCTKYCPTCICHKQTFLPSLDGEGGEQVREWASCQSEAHSYVGGKVTRAARRERYRMRVTHKMVYQQAQYGPPGCVGCGRCVTYCENSIDMFKYLKQIMADAAGESHE